MPDVRYARRRDVLWRLAPDRVLVRRAWTDSDHEDAADLLGVTALVWLAADEEGSVSEIVRRLTDDGLLDEPVSAEAVDDALEQLVTKCWMTRAAGS